MWMLLKDEKNLFSGDRPPDYLSIIHGRHQKELFKMTEKAWKSSATALPGSQPAAPAPAGVRVQPFRCWTWRGMPVKIFFYGHKIFSEKQFVNRPRDFQNMLVVPS